MEVHSLDTISATSSKIMEDGSSLMIRELSSMILMIWRLIVSEDSIGEDRARMRTCLFMRKLKKIQCI